MNRAFCPGPYPWESLFGYLEGAGKMGVPDGWRDDGATLAAPNGVAVVRGFRAYILAHAWEADDLPLAPEVATPSESTQLFARTGLVWRPESGVQRAPLGEELIAARAELARRAGDMVAIEALRAALDALKRPKS